MWKVIKNLQKKKELKKKLINRKEDILKYSQENEESSAFVEHA